MTLHVQGNPNKNFIWLLVRSYGDQKALGGHTQSVEKKETINQEFYSQRNYKWRRKKISPDKWKPWEILLADPPYKKYYRKFFRMKASEPRRKFKSTQNIEHY